MRRTDRSAAHPEKRLPPAVAAEAVPDSSGAPLDQATQRAMAGRFAQDFSQVRVHADAQAADLAAGQHARAYTVGQHVVFGSGRYAPHTEAGEALLAHELGHVVEQQATGTLAVQRSDLADPAPVKPADPEAALGERLVRDFPSGIALAFYAPMPGSGEEARNAAQKWARREQALAVRGKTVTAGSIVFGEPMLDTDHPLAATVQALGTLLARAVSKAPPSPAGPLPPGTGPGTVRTLAVFAHGTTDWCGLGAIDSSTAASVIKSIAPALAPNVTVILYSCNAGRDPDASEEWVKGTMQGGGKSSLAAVTRDALIAEGKAGSVWGHTTTGHVSENFALREFDTTAGKGSEGSSFVARYVFSTVDKVIAAGELLDGLAARGFTLDPDGNGGAAATAAVEAEMYRCYAEANRELTAAGGGKLAESAPVHPVEVGKQIKEYWTNSYWPRRRSHAVDALVKRLGLTGRGTTAPH